MYKLILLRHGQSTWNLLNKFTGWTDVPLSPKGKKEASAAGKKLMKYEVDIVFTSVMKRATQTTKLALKIMRQKPKIIRAWQLNERHYGDLQGLNKSEMAKKFGEAQVKIWRRSYSIPPPKMKANDSRYILQIKKYPMVSRKNQPLTECLKDTVKRVVPYWKKEIVPSIKKGNLVMISAHGNSLRAIVKHLDKVPEKEITELNIPTGMPLIYELDSNLKPLKHYYLASKKELADALNVVKAQGKAK